MLSHNSLIAFYRMEYLMTQHFKYSITELRSMIPFERTLHLDMIQETLERKRLAAQQR